MFFCFIFSSAARLIELKIKFIRTIFQLNFIFIFISSSDPNLLPKKSVKQKIKKLWPNNAILEWL